MKRARVSSSGAGSAEGPLMTRAALELETPRLLLRQFRESDLDEYAAMCADPDVMKYLKGPIARADAWRQMATFIGHWTLRGYGLYAVEEKATGDLVGRIGYFNPEGWVGFEVGWLLRKESWGKGFAAEAGSAALQHAFTHMGMNDVISVIAPENTASRRVAERLGEVVTGSTTLGETDVVIYSINRTRWAQCNSHESSRQDI